MDNEKELHEMQREWRLYVRKTLDDISTDVAAIKESCARKSDMDTLGKRVETLEGDRKKLIGAALALQAVGAFVMWIFNFKA